MPGFFPRAKSLLFENSSMRQTVFKNTFWLSASTIGGRIIRAVILIYAARVLGAAGYGVFSYAVGLAGFFSLFSDIGVSSILTREGARNPARLPAYLGTSFAIKLVLVAANTILLFAVVPFFTNISGALALLPWAALLIAFDGLRDFTTSLTRASERMELEALIITFTNVAITGIGLGLLILQPSPLALMIGYTLGAGCGMVLAYAMLWKHFWGFWRHFEKGLVRRILVEGIPFGLMGFLGSLMLNTDTVMLGWYMNATALGLYSAAQRPIFILYMVPQTLSTVLFPAMSRLAILEGDRFRMLMERIMSFAFFLAIPIFVGGLVLGRNIIVLLFGAEYEAATPAFLILLATALTHFPASFLANGIFAKNEQRSAIVFLAIGTLGNALFNFLLIPHWGIAGSAVATILAQILANGFTWWRLKRVAPFQTLRHLGKIAAASLLMGAFVFVLERMGVHVIISILAGIAVYGAALVAMREELLRYLDPRSLFS